MYQEINVMLTASLIAVFYLNRICANVTRQIVKFPEAALSLPCAISQSGLIPTNP
jgi:hypothetical protein